MDLWLGLRQRRDWFKPIFEEITSAAIAAFGDGRSTIEAGMFDSTESLAALEVAPPSLAHLNRQDTGPAVGTRAASPLLA